MNHRVIPVLGLYNGGVYKTKKFVHPTYVGDPINAVRVFNEKQVSELVVCGFRNSLEGIDPNLPVLKEIASEAFMPLAYIGGIRHLNSVEQLVSMGYEKLGFLTAAFLQPTLVKETVSAIGASSVIGCLDLRKDEIHGTLKPYILSGKQALNLSVEEAIDHLHALGVGEILINHMDRDGTLEGYDTNVIERLRPLVHVPMIFLGGAKSQADLIQAANLGVEGVAASARFVFYGKHQAVLINYPNPIFSQSP